MKIHHDLSHVDRYLANYSHTGLESFESEFQITLRRIRKFKEIGPATKVLEVGTGIGTVFEGSLKELANTPRRFKPVKTIALCFSPGTFFICKKGEILS